MKSPRVSPLTWLATKTIPKRRFPSIVFPPVTATSPRRLRDSAQRRAMGCARRAPHTVPQCAPSLSRPHRALARDRPRSLPGARTGRARRPDSRHVRARRGRAEPGHGPSGRDPDRGAGSAHPTDRCARATATPGSPSAPPGRGPPARWAPARPGCGRAAAHLRTAPVAASRRRRLPNSLR